MYFVLINLEAYIHSSQVSRVHKRVCNFKDNSIILVNWICNQIQNILTIMWVPVKETKRNETKTKSNEICKVRKRNPTKWNEICKVRKRNPTKWNEICKVRKRNPTKRNDEICKVRKQHITKRNEIYKVRKQYQMKKKERIL